MLYQVKGERGGDRSGGRATNISLIRAAEKQKDRKILLGWTKLLQRDTTCTFPGPGRINMSRTLINTY